MDSNALSEIRNVILNALPRTLAPFRIAFRISARKFEPGETSLGFF